MRERPCRRLTQNFATGGIVGHTYLKDDDDDDGTVDADVMILTLIKAENFLLYISLNGSDVRPYEGNLKMLEAGICIDLQRLVCKSCCKYSEGGHCKGFTQNHTI